MAGGSPLLKPYTTYVDLICLTQHGMNFVFIRLGGSKLHLRQPGCSFESFVWRAYFFSFHTTRAAFAVHQSVFILV